MDGVFLANDVTVNYFNSIRKTWHRILYTRDIIRPLTPVFYFNKHSILPWMFDRKLEICIESGLTMYWIRKYQQKPKEDKYRNPMKLGMTNIIGIMQITTALYFVAFIIFLMEVFGPKNGYIRRVLDFLTY